MSREELVQWLARLVADGVLTEAEAAEIVRQYDEGGEDQLPMFYGLPIAPPLALDQPSGFDYVEFVAVMSVAQSAALRRGVRPAWPNSPDAPQLDFETKVRRLAQRLSQGGMTTSEWQRAMRLAITEYTVSQVVLGGRLTVMTPRIQEELRRSLRVQFAYLSRFADEAALGRLSEAQLASRSIQYGGYGRGEFYRRREEQDSGQFGMVVDYISKDDPRTCVPCIEADENGPYLPGAGPMPGQVCLGAGYCRCERRVRYSPADYLILTRG